MGRPVRWPMSDETYHPERAERLVAMLRELARRIQTLDREGALLREAPELQRVLGDLRAELFRYEVRHTFDSPETAEHRRIAGEAARGWTPDADPDEEDGWPPHGP
jgi:hypothetical protein